MTHLNIFANQDYGSFLIALGVFLLIFFLIRELLCWYWKLNQIVSLLEEIKKNTETVQEPLPVEKVDQKPV